MPRSPSDRRALAGAWRRLIAGIALGGAAIAWLARAPGAALTFDDWLNVVLIAVMVLFALLVGLARQYGQTLLARAVRRQDAGQICRVPRQPDPTLALAGGERLTLRWLWCAREVFMLLGASIGVDVFVTLRLDDTVLNFIFTTSLGVATLAKIVMLALEWLIVPLIFLAPLWPAFGQSVQADDEGLTVRAGGLFRRRWRLRWQEIHGLARQGTGTGLGNTAYIVIGPDGVLEFRAPRRLGVRSFAALDAETLARLLATITARCDVPIVIAGGRATLLQITAADANRLPLAAPALQPDPVVIAQEAAGEQTLRIRGRYRLGRVLGGYGLFSVALLVLATICSFFAVELPRHPTVSLTELLFRSVFLSATFIVPAFVVLMAFSPLIERSRAPDAVLATPRLLSNLKGSQMQWSDARAWVLLPATAADAPAVYALIGAHASVRWQVVPGSPTGQRLLAIVAARTHLPLRILAPETLALAAGARAPVASPLAGT